MNTKIISKLVQTQQLNTKQSTFLLEPMIERYNQIINGYYQRYHSGWGRSSEKGDLAIMISNILSNQKVGTNKILDLLSEDKNKKLSKEWVISRYTLEKLLNNVKNLDNNQAVKLMNYISNTNSAISYTSKMGQLLKNDVIWERYKVKYLNMIFSKSIRRKIRSWFYRWGNLDTQLKNALEHYKVEGYIGKQVLDNSGTENLFYNYETPSQKNYDENYDDIGVNLNWREREKLKNNIYNKNKKKFVDFVSTLVGKKISSLINNREELIKYLNSI